MTERRLILPGSLVRAILSDNKNQHRMAVRRQNCWLNGKRPTKKDWEGLETLGDAMPCNRHDPGIFLPRANKPSHVLTPRVQVGDKFWVAETFWHESLSVEMPILHYDDPGHSEWARANPLMEDSIFEAVPPLSENIRDHIRYCETDNEPEISIESGSWEKRPSIHMSRWASRLTLEVTAIRAERLQDITERDMRAEGATIPPNNLFPTVNAWDKLNRQFRKSWDSLNPTYPSGGNHPVWVYDFERLEE